MTGNSTPTNASNMSLTRNSDFATSFDGLDANYGAGLDTGDFAWDEPMSNFTAVNTAGTSSSTRTVSPKDLFNDYLGSAPASTAFTNLTSPDMDHSPYGTSSTEVSPLFNDNLDVGADTSNWFSLFPDADGSAPPMERNVSNVSNGQSSDGNSPDALVLDQTNYNRRKSSANAASPAGHARHSSVNGVKPRRRKGPLPPIVVAADDRTAVKRARNTLAARDSRQRKLDHLSGLEGRIKELEDRELEFKEALASYGYNGPLMQM